MSKQNSNSDTLLSEVLLREVYDFLPVGVLFINFEGKILEANSVMEDLTGYQLKELQDQNIKLLCKECNPDKMVNDTLEGEEMLIVGKEEEVPVSVFNQTSETEDGVIVVMKDLEKAKQKEKEVEDKVEELKRFNRLATGRELKMVELKREKQELEEENEQLESEKEALKKEVKQLKKKASQNQK